MKNVLQKTECERFLRHAVQPALMASAKIDLNDPSTWACPETGGDDGAIVCGTNGHPIPQESDDSRWPALFGAERLLKFLDALHETTIESLDSTVSLNNVNAGRSRRWRWIDGAASGVGWIHLRFPSRDELDWEPPQADVGWHVDGSPQRLDERRSVVVLPLVTSIHPGGGGTALLPGSHHEVGAWLVDNGSPGAGRSKKSLHNFLTSHLVPKYLARFNTGDHRAINEANGSAGDVLILHPFVVHSTSNACRVSVHADGIPRENKVRVTFNLATEWADGRPLAHSHSKLTESTSNMLPLLSPLESTLFHAALSRTERTSSTRLIRYGETIELAFITCMRMLGVEADGVARAEYPRRPPRSQHKIRLIPIRETGSCQHVRFGDLVQLLYRATDGAWQPITVASFLLDDDLQPMGLNVDFALNNDVPPVGFWLEAACNFSGVPVDTSDAFFLRAAVGTGRRYVAPNAKDCRTICAMRRRREDRFLLRAFKLSSLRG